MPSSVRSTRSSGAPSRAGVAVTRHYIITRGVIRVAFGSSPPLLRAPMFCTHVQRVSCVCNTTITSAQVTFYQEPHCTITAIITIVAPKTPGAPSQCAALHHSYWHEITSCTLRHYTIINNNTWLHLHGIKILSSKLMSWQTFYWSRSRIRSSSFFASAANLRMPSESFSTAIWSSLWSLRNWASVRLTFSRSEALAVWRWEGGDEVMGGRG